MNYNNNTNYEAPKERIYQTNCIKCDGEIRLEDTVEENEIIGCPDCGIELEVISTDPIKLDQAPTVEQDWGE